MAGGRRADILPTQPGKSCPAWWVEAQSSKSCPRSLWDWWPQCLWKRMWRCKWGECQKNYSSCNWNAALSFLVENWAQFSYKEEEDAGVDGETGVALGTVSGVDTPLKRTLRESWSRPKLSPVIVLALGSWKQSSPSHSEAMSCFSDDLNQPRGNM